MKFKVPVTDTKKYVKYICPKCGKITYGCRFFTIIHEQCNVKFKRIYEKEK